MHLKMSPLTLTKLSSDMKMQLKMDTRNVDT